MNEKSFGILLLASLLAGVSARAATLYVDAGSTNPIGPYTNWLTAAAAIQDAVDASVAGDEVVVTNGIYSTGGRSAGTNDLVNRVAVDRAVTVRSINGPWSTVINGAESVRGAYLVSGAILTGFMVSNGLADNGGGVFCESEAAVVSRCVFTDNYATTSGGGVYSGTINNCLLLKNFADIGGGARKSMLNNCTLTANWASYSGSGGASGGRLNSCIIYYNNVGWPNANYSVGDTVLNYCCTTPDPGSGTGNITAEPRFLDRWANQYGNFHLPYNSPCVNAGNNSFASGTDLDGHERISGGTVDMGAYEWLASPTRFVSGSSPNPVLPYDSWPTAAHTIQDAVDASGLGEEIIVTNGVYATGGRAFGNSYNPVINRVAVDHAISLRSVNGPELTIIQGYQSPGITNGYYSIRCAYLTNGAVLSGFTLTNGATMGPIETGQSNELYCGGGVYCASSNVVVSNCILTGNAAALEGGGAFSGSLFACSLMTNSARRGGGVANATLTGCTVMGNSGSDAGGGAYKATLTNCTLTGNLSGNGGGLSEGTMVNCSVTSNLGLSSGGGVVNGTLFNCILMGNSTSVLGGYGGGASSSTLHQCTVVSNYAGYKGGGIFWSKAINCVIYYNTCPTPGLTNYSAYNSMLTNCCTTPMPTNYPVGSTIEAPRFVDLARGNLRLRSDSPCINAGNNAYAAGSVDLDGNPRVSGASVDMGAYEFQGVGAFVAWLQDYALPTDGTAHFTDPDGDGYNNYQEYRCGTDPTNALSALRLLPPAPVGTNLTLAWPSATGRSYCLDYSPDLSATPRFLPLATNLPGGTGTTTFTLTNPAAAPLRFYRVGVE